MKHKKNLTKEFKEDIEENPHHKRIPNYRRQRLQEVEETEFKETLREIGTGSLRVDE